MAGMTDEEMFNYMFEEQWCVAASKQGVREFRGMHACMSDDTRLPCGPCCNCHEPLRALCGAVLGCRWCTCLSGCA